MWNFSFVDKDEVRSFSSFESSESASAEESTCDFKQEPTENQQTHTKHSRHQDQAEEKEVCNLIPTSHFTVC